MVSVRAVGGDVFFICSGEEDVKCGWAGDTRRPVMLSSLTDGTVHMLDSSLLEL